MQKYLLLLLIGIGALLVVIILFVFILEYIGAFLLGTNPLKQQSVVNIFTKNALLFGAVAGSLSQFSQEVNLSAGKKERDQYILSLSVYDAKTLSSTTRTEAVTDAELNRQLKRIFGGLRYFSISKEEGTVLFTRRSGLAFEQGLAFSADSLPVSRYVEFESFDPIGGGWYYYQGK